MLPGLAVGHQRRPPAASAAHPAVPSHHGWAHHRNGASLVKLPPVRVKKRRAWTSDEARRFLESARADDDPYYAALVLVLVLGLRKGEMLGLTWKDVDLQTGELTIDMQLQRVGHQLLHRETKTPGSEAVLPLPDICAVALIRPRAVQDTVRELAGAAWHRLDFVFTTRYGTPIEPRNFNRYWDRRCDAARVRRITVRDARRTCASLLADLDVHPSGGDADSAARAVRHHDGDLHRGVAGRDPRCAQAAREGVGAMKGSLLYFAAVCAAFEAVRPVQLPADLRFGGPPGTRTPNLWIKSQQLCH